MNETALSIIQKTRRILTLDEPTTLLSLTDPDEKQQLECLNQVLEELRQARCWTVQKRLHSFATVASTDSYQLPKDFYSPVLRTYWNDDESAWLLPATDQYFSHLKYGNAESSHNYTIRIWGSDNNPNSAGGQFQVTPTPSAAQTLYFEYLTQSLYRPQNWQASTAYTTSDYVFANGHNYVCASNGTSGATAPSGTSTGISDGTATWDYYGDAYTEVIADTDVVIYDADLVKIGLKALFLEESNADYLETRRRFEERIESASKRYQGGKVYSTARGRAQPRYAYPYRGWNL